MADDIKISEEYENIKPKESDLYNYELTKQISRLCEKGSKNIDDNESERKEYINAFKRYEELLTAISGDKPWLSPAETDGDTYLERKKRIIEKAKKFGWSELKTISILTSALHMELKKTGLIPLKTRVDVDYGTPDDFRDFIKWKYPGLIK